MHVDAWPNHMANNKAITESHGVRVSVHPLKVHSIMVNGGWCWTNSVVVWRDLLMGPRGMVRVSPLSHGSPSCLWVCSNPSSTIPSHLPQSTDLYSSEEKIMTDLLKFEIRVRMSVEIFISQSCQSQKIKDWSDTDHLKRKWVSLKWQGRVT